MFYRWNLIAPSTFAKASVPGHVAMMVPQNMIGKVQTAMGNAASDEMPISSWIVNKK